MSYCTVQSPEIFHITGLGGQTYFGADQEWFRERWQRQAGCGPTNSAHLLWYLSQTRPGCNALANCDGKQQEGFLSLMEEVWNYVTPGKMGVNTTDLFIGGNNRYGEAHGFNLSFRSIEIPALIFLRPKQEEVVEFITQALEEDLPLAFLNLSRGKLRNLDSWHWVTLIALDTSSLIATIYNQGQKQEIDMGLWLETTQLGGGFVAIESCSDV